MRGTGLSAWCIIAAFSGSAVALCGSAFQAPLISAASARHCCLLTSSSESPQAPNDERLKDAVAELREGPRELAELYNDYAVPWRCWGLALEMVDVAQYISRATCASSGTSTCARAVLLPGRGLVQRMLALLALCFGWTVSAPDGMGMQCSSSWLHKLDHL